MTLLPYSFRRVLIWSIFSGSEAAKVSFRDYPMSVSMRSDRCHREISARNEKTMARSAGIVYDLRRFCWELRMFGRR
jgi:hypothetical protein